MNGDVEENGITEEPAKKGGNKRMSVERIYQKKSQLEHILLRPDTYIGSVEPVTENMWVYDNEKEQMTQRDITYVPGLYKIFDEILVNAADNKQRDPRMDTIKVDIDRESNVISIYNNGKGIPVTQHKTEKMFVPSLIFGHLLTSSNFNDEEQKVTGGRNGFGAKLCNIFSTKFTVETAAKEYKRSFKQTWAQNMTKTTDPKIKDFTGSDFTKIMFIPDLKKFKMESLDKDIMDLLSKRAFDVAASSRGVKVYLNGKRLPVKGFKDYVELYLKDKIDDAGNPVKVVYETANSRWEVAVALSDKGFQQVSFVNSIATTKGGRHVDHVTDLLVKQLIEVIKKKNKAGINIKPFQIKNHIWVFVNCLIVNPTFDSQTKENMTLQVKNFGSKCHISDKFINGVNKCGIIEGVMAWAKFKAQNQLNTKCNSKKQTKIKGIPKLEDANDAGTRNSIDCTLILTEGDSAKALAVAGLGVIGRDRYGVFPLRGKLLNVREASHKQILENPEINNLIKIMGLQYKKKYETTDDLRSLRYGKIMIMTDQDQDGSHIKGLFINFVQHNWPSLLRLPFLEQFITPIVKATKAKEEFSFYSLPEFEEWKKDRDNWHTYKIKYYKGLGTSTSKEAKEYFSDMLRHRITFKHTGDNDDHSINMAFSKKCVDQRKEWLTNWMAECKRRRELGLSELYLYEKDTHSVNYTDFINKELVLFSNLDNERSIPSLVDGFKPGQRKVMFTCFKRNDKREVKVVQLAGSVAEVSAYHHGETSLMSTIINLAQNFVGSNNINVLQPIGQFGTRHQGGKDAASPRYIFTMLSPLARHIFHPDDVPVLNHLTDDNQKIEPEWYIPVIPMVLVNGADGIGTGWMTKISNYNPREIISNLLRLLNGEELLLMHPWFKNFKGSLEKLDNQRYVVNGEVMVIGANKVEVNELPFRTWTQNYKENFLEPQLAGTEKTLATLTDYKEYHTDTTVKFVISMTEEKMMKMEEDGFHKSLKLQSQMSTTSMVLFDENGCLKKYETVEDIMNEFFTLRLKFYEKRKTYMEGHLEAESRRLSNQARFILEKCDGKLVVENKKKKDMIAELIKKGYDSDPTKAWKKLQGKNTDQVDHSSDSEDDEEKSSGPDYDYLLGMTMWSLTKEKKDELLKKKDCKLQEVKILKGKTPSDLWKEDLKIISVELDRVELLEKEEESAGTKKAVKTKGGKTSRPKQTLLSFKPSSMGRRIEPRVDAEMKKKVEKAAAAKENKGKRKKLFDIEKDDLDSLVEEGGGKSLAGRLGNSPQLIEKKSKEEKQIRKKNADDMKQSKLDFKPKKKGKSPWESDNEESEGNSDSDHDIYSIPRERTTVSRRAVDSKVKYTFSEDENDNSDNEPEFYENKAVKDDEFVPTVDSDLENSVVAPPAKRKKNPAATIAISDTDSEFESRSPKKSSSKSKQDDESQPSASDLFDSLLGDSSDTEREQKASPAKKSNNILSDGGESKKNAISDSGDDDIKLKMAYSDSDDDLKPKKKTKLADSDSDIEFIPKEKAKFIDSDSDEPKPNKKAKKAEDGVAKPKKVTKKKDEDNPKLKKASKPKKKKSDSEEDMFITTKKPAAKKKKKTNSSDGSDMDFSEQDVLPSRTATSSRARKIVKYTQDSDMDDDDF